MYKQSTYVIALFLGTSKAFIETPESNSYFATGMNGDEDLGEDITMKGNKFHFNQAPGSDELIQKVDISEKGIDENVHWFSNPNTETLNWERKQVPFAGNGSGPKAFPPTADINPTATYAQRRGEDISEKGIDENVHWFSNPNTETLNWERKQVPFAANGSGPKAFPPTPDMNPTATYAQIQKLPKVLPGMEKKKGISEKGMDEDVHDFANNMPEVPRLSYPRSETAPQNNGVSKKSHPSFHNDAIGSYAQRQDRPYKGDDGVAAYNGSGPKAFPPFKDEPIQAYHQTADPTTLDDPIAYNGTGKKAWPAFHNDKMQAYVQRQEPGSSGSLGYNDPEPSMNGSGSKAFKPTFYNDKVGAYVQNPSGSEDDAQPAMNGSGAKAFKPTFYEGKVAPYLAQTPTAGKAMKKGISEKGIDEDVHDFANNMPEVPRLSYPRSEVAHSANGSGAKAHPAFHNDPIGAYAQGPAPQERKKKDIAEKGMDEEVHGFANSMVEPLAWPRKQVPFAANGSGSSAHPPFHNEAIGAYAQGPAPQERKKKDIAEKGMDEEVHGFANSMVEPLAWPRKQVPFAENGSGPKAHPPTHNEPIGAYPQKMDIANKEVRPDVYTTVHSMVNPTALWRGNKAPKSNYEAWWGDAGPPKTDLPAPACPTEEVESEPDMAKLKAAKFMADEKARDEKAAAKEDAKQEKAIKAAEDEEAKEKAASAPAAAEEKKDEAAAGEEKKEGEEEKKDGAEEKKDGDKPKEEEKKDGDKPKEEPKKEDAKKDDAPKDDKKTATKTAKAAAAPKKEATPGKIVKLMTGDLIFDKTNNLWRHEPVFIQTEE